MNKSAGPSPISGSWPVALLCAALAYCAAAVAADNRPASHGDGAAAAITLPEKLTPEQADALLGRLTDAQARQLLAQQLKKEAGRNTAAETKVSEGLGVWLVKLRSSLEGTGESHGRRAALIAEGWALVPDALRTGTDKVSGGKGLRGFLLQIATFILLLAVAMAAFWSVRRAVVARLAREAPPLEAGFGERLAAALLRLAYDSLPVAALALVGFALAHLAFEARTADRTFHVTYMTGAMLVAATAAVSRFVLSPESPALRLIGIPDGAARFLHRWLVRVVAVSVFAWLTAGLFILTGVPLKAHLVLVLITGALVGAMLLAMVLSCRREVAAAIRASGPGGEGGGWWRTHFADTWHIFAILYLALIWSFWARSMLDQGRSTIWAAIASLAIVLVYPLLDRWIGRGIDDMLGSGGAPPAQGAAGAAPPRRQEYAVVLHRVMRVLLVVALLAGVNELWGFDTFGEAQVKLRRALLASSFDLLAAIVLAAIGWQLVKAGIDRRLAPRMVDGVMVEPTPRAKTLLPLARKFIVVVIIVMTVMLVLSALGVNIGPLLAGAGVVGLAIGFGAQTLVRDVISGVFFLVDDAFRVGEYVISGSYKGTVESIGLRSVKLRHHRGPVFTVPFGELRAIQNQSRDWVIDKLTIGITYDSDLEKARKLIKRIGQDLAADPELAPKIIEPLKMQGVEQFGDYAIQIRLKMKTVPGEQFSVRTKAYALIKTAFDKNGIKFAFPTVQVASAEGAPVAEAAGAAAARRALPGAQPEPQG